MNRNDRGIGALAISLAVVSVAACGSGSGGTGGGTSSTHTTSMTGTGGAGTGGTTNTGGSTTGTGGTGAGGGDGGACLTCADWASTNGSPDKICAGEAKTDYDALIKCVCTDNCATECAGASPCVPMGQPSAACGNCEGAKCGAEATACLAH